jgi:hypothetical protein
MGEQPAVHLVSSNARHLQFTIRPGTLAVRSAYETTT